MSKSQLLINEPPLQVLPSLAIAIGLNEAIVLQQLHYWLNNPKAGVERNGHKWIFNTYEEWQEGNFPFWSVSTVKRTFASLEEKLVVIAEQLDIKQRDMTKYYRINYDHLGTLEQVNLTRWNGSNRADVNNESETTTEKTNTAYRRGEQESPDKLAEWLKMAHFDGAKQSERIDAILSYLGVTFRRNTETKEWKEFAKYILSAEKEFGWKIEEFIGWLFAKPDYHPDYWSVKRMMEFYPSAFTQVKATAPIKEYQPLDESEFVPSPARKP